jgi:hypothetical protein
MSSNSQDQEIDLGQIGKGINKILKGIINSIFDFIFFLKSKIIIIAILFATGVALAYIFDSKLYIHEISVIPNFGSNEYLYKKIEQIDTKLREDDEDFFNKIGIKNHKNIVNVEIQAYPAIYSFVNNKQQENNFELIKLMAEDGNIDKIMKDEVTSKNYYHHKISIQTKGMIKEEEIIKPLLNYLNTNPYFEVQQKVYQQNLTDKIALNDSLIKQIDNLIILLSSNNSLATISISEKNSIPELVEKKDMLISETQYLRTNVNIFDKIIKEESSITNIRDYKPLLLNNKILFPLMLILVYMLIFSIIKTFKQLEKRRIKE